MNILLTGNNGYVGSVLEKKIIELGFNVTGFDTNYFRDCNLTKTESNKKQIIRDIRQIKLNDLEGIDAVIHLAGLSNDPLGEFDPEITNHINYLSTKNLANLSMEAGVKRFVYASTQSMYGISTTDEELDEDLSKKNPITAYAKTKLLSEEYLKNIASNDFIVTFFRPSTVFGPSPRFRSDIVFNSLVCCAYTTGTIEILSDGSPWRPVIHIEDVCSAFIAGLLAPSSLVNKKAFNVGIQNGNYTVKNLAEAAIKAVPGAKLKFLNKHSDPRSYKVSFDKILNELKDYYKPKWNLINGGIELVNFFKNINMKESTFRGSKTNRIIRLKELIDEKKINNNLYWK